MTEQFGWALPLADRYFAPILAADPRGFEIDHLEVALSHCRNFRTAIDGGAHIGTWTAAMAKRFQKVIAFEPALDTYECLTRNLEGKSNVESYPAALGAFRSRCSVVDDKTRPGNTGSRYITRGGNEVPMVTVDSCHLDDLDFLKLDLEGYEPFALAGSIETLERCRPVVMIEVKRFDPPRFGLDVESGARFLLARGYKEAARVKNDRIYSI